ncbi:MaoC/PaaZ C-terminal domain-containing protein [Alteromonadaceae bacterium BrNp21-10]|nr:MaoC/PaaZ C-terminal domain-containing protein [Alteromonadaceae bacterium BrNp21-10]
MSPSNSPSLARLFLQAALKKTINTTEPVLPTGHFEALDVSIKPAHLEAYHRVIGWLDSYRVAPTYLQILAFKQHLQLLTAGDFPFASMGLVHMSNRIEQYVPINVEDNFTLTCSCQNLSAHKKGWLFDIVTSATVNGQLVWQSSSRSLYRCQQQKLVESRHTGVATGLMPVNNNFNIPPNIGRQYAKVSGDFNPIHLWPVTAKLLGFRRHIAHGMWSKARCIAELAATLPEQCCIEVEFKRPLFLPAKVVLASEQQVLTHRFDLRDSHSGNLHLQGTIQSL